MAIGHRDYRDAHRLIDDFVDELMSENSRQVDEIARLEAKLEDAEDELKETQEEIVELQKLVQEFQRPRLQELSEKST